MNAEFLRTKKITMSTLKSFINKNDNLFVESISSFNGMTDGIEYSKNNKLVPVSKNDAIGFNGIYCVGRSNDYFSFKETDTHYGIEVYNSCGCGILWTTK